MKMLQYLFLLLLIDSRDGQTSTTIQKTKKTSSTTQASNQVIPVDSPIKPSNDNEFDSLSGHHRLRNIRAPTSGPPTSSSNANSGSTQQSTSGSPSSSNNANSGPTQQPSSESPSSTATSPTTSNSKPDRAYWRPFFFVVPEDAFPAGYDEDLNVIYIIRATGMTRTDDGLEHFIQIVTKWTIMFGGSVPLLEMAPGEKGGRWFEILCAMKVNGEYNLVWTRPKNKITADDPDFIYAKSPGFYSTRQQQGWWIARYGICNSAFIAYNSNYDKAEYKTIDCFNSEDTLRTLYAPDLEVLRYGAWNKNSSQYHQRTYETARFDFHEFDIREKPIDMSEITAPAPTRSTTTTTAIATTTPEEEIFIEVTTRHRDITEFDPSNSLPKICYASADEYFCVGD